MKICRSPQCKGATFDDSVDQCPNCTGKLEPLLVTEGSVIIPPAQDQTPPGAGPQCPKCGAKMVEGTSFCEKGCQLSGASPNQGGFSGRRMNTGPEIPTDAKASLWLECHGAKAECKDGDVLGRGGSVRADFFDNPKVSSNHCAVFCTGGQWLIQRLFTGRNPTYLDGSPLEQGQSKPLMGVHLLQIGSTFSIRLQVQKIS